jgi:hypothetical protein
LKILKQLLRTTNKEKELKLKMPDHFQRPNNFSYIIALRNHLKTATAMIKCGEGPNVSIPVTGVPGVSSSRQTSVKS